mmetsp:Transcript_58851/g.164374  ORF Transcript_58851/g.164374 Transcript_58851/m.164374 type:complete len:207 (+) Transcript_58851:366-986(+)
MYLRRHMAWKRCPQRVCKGGPRSQVDSPRESRQIMQSLRSTQSGHTTREQTTPGHALAPPSRARSSTELELRRLAGGACRGMLWTTPALEARRCNSPNILELASAANHAPLEIPWNERNGILSEAAPEDAEASASPFSRSLYDNALNGLASSQSSSAAGDLREHSNTPLSRPALMRKLSPPAHVNSTSCSMGESLCRDGLQGSSKA